MNHMKEIANMFGVEFNEKFIVVTDTNVKLSDVYFNEDGLIVHKPIPSGHTLTNLLIGKYHIIKRPYIPEFNDTYYLIDHNGEIDFDTWTNSDIDYYRFNAGNCFANRIAANEADKETILNNMKGKYEAL